ncbi:hypothetical protein [Mesorhizobium sp. M1405]|uniref:DUF6894 family protein n=1 Tax=Mesorhizobium sp. M1405 TaxID=2957098 RepID=UPI00333D224A
MEQAEPSAVGEHGALFDVRDNDRLFPDDEGTRLAGGLNAARAEAFAALADYVREIAPPDSRCCLAIEVRDENSQPLLKATMTFEVELIHRQ